MSEAGIKAFQAGDWVAAIVAFRDAAAADPQDLMSRLNLARCCFNLKDFVACNTVLRGLMQAGPPQDIQLAALQLQTYVAPFDPAMDDAALLQLSRDWATALRLEHPAAPLPPAPAPVARDRLSVGFLCAYFGAPIDYLPIGLLDRHRFRVIGYGAARRAVAQSDSMPRFDLYRDLSALDDRAAAEQIRADRTDILVDLGGQGWGQRNGIMLYRPAPVQVGWSNRLYPASAALVDWLLADWVTMPSGAERREEVRVCRLAEPVLPCNRLQPPPPVGHPSADAPLTFGTVASPFKLNSACIALWARVMAELPGSRMLYAMETMSRDQASHVSRLFRDAGIDGDRLELRTLGPGDLPLAINDVDVVLDTQPFTANFTTWQAAAQGVPMVTLRGERFAGRMAAAMLTALGRVDWVAETPDQFVAIAVAMAGQARAAAGQRSARADRARTARLADPAFAARLLGRALDEIWAAETEQRSRAAA